jgi:predicted ArsR family transcriptional regulator
VKQLGVRRGSGKPSYVYDLTPDAEHLFPKSYSQVLYQLLEELDARMTATDLEDLLSTVGRRIAAKWKIQPGDLRMRLEAAIEVLNELGGMAELEIKEENYTIRGYSCPLSAIVPGHPEICHLTETLLTEIVDIPIKEQCERNGKVRCCFVAEKVAS